MLNTLSLCHKRTNVLTEKQCTNIVNWVLRNGTREKPGTFSNRDSKLDRNANLYFFNNREVSEKLLDHVQDANKTNWNVKLNFCEPLQMSEYNPGDFYTWHKDSFSKPMNPWNRKEDSIRKMSFVVALNDKSEYEGGELQLVSGWQNEKVTYREAQLYRPGDMIVFPSLTDHRVTKITKGKRYTLVGWVHGPPFI